MPLILFLNKHPDLVLMDIRMPKMLGLDVVEATETRDLTEKS